MLDADSLHSLLTRKRSSKTDNAYQAGHSHAKAVWLREGAALINA